MSENKYAKVITILNSNRNIKTRKLEKNIKWKKADSISRTKAKKDFMANKNHKNGNTKEKYWKKINWMKVWSFFRCKIWLVFVKLTKTKREGSIYEYQEYKKHQHWLHGVYTDHKEMLGRVLIQSGKTFLKIYEEKWFTQKWRSMNPITIVEAELGWLSQQRNIQSKMHSG